MSDQPNTGARRRKPFFDQKVKCFHCGKPNRVKAFRKVIVPTEPAEAKIEVEVETGDADLRDFGDKE